MKKIEKSIFALILAASPSLASAGGSWAVPSPFLSPISQGAFLNAGDSKNVEEYLSNISENTDYTRGDRHLDGVALNGSKDGNQQFDIDEPRKVYTKLLNCVFTARAGETLTPVFLYSGNWMNGYVYLDQNNDGVFDAELEADKSIPEGSDILSFSNLEGVNSKGEKLGNQNVLNPPSFKLPSNLANGIYRLRYKVDWSSIDPAGRMGDGNDILKNGGAICDILLNVHGHFSIVNTLSHNGEVVAGNGLKLSDTNVPFGKAMTVKIKPAEGYTYDGIRVRHGYHLLGDSLVHGNPQYKDVVFPAYLFRDDKFEIPGEYMDGDVLIEGIFVKDNGTVAPGTEDYALNFSKDLKRTHADRLLRSISFKATKGGNTTLSVGSKEETVYSNLMPKAVSVVPGDEVNVDFNFKGSGVHYYLYIDLNQNGQFRPVVGENGVPGVSSELVSYSYLNGLNSKGEKIEEAGTVSVDNMPSFKIPEFLAHGNYRARLKVDFDNVDPAGREAMGTEGGYIFDFLLNVHAQKHPLTLVSTNGNIYGGGNTGLPMTITPMTTLRVVPTPVAPGYVAEEMTIKHGHNFDGPQYIHGNRQWGEYTVPARTYSLPKDSVTGDVMITVHYTKGENADYDLVFFDEFNGENGTEPDAFKWRRCERQGATWNRWLSDSKDVVYLKDGNLVTRAIPNPDKAADPVPMITGGIKSLGKFAFTYGKLECRAKVNSYVGTFPAIWLMPVNMAGGWPSCGEIDIFEAVDGGQTAYGTVHSHWTYDLGHRGDPVSSFNMPTPMDRYHTYGFEWNERSMSWFVDGKKMGTYTKSNNSNALNQGQWPFDKHFYIILNQSVGNHGQWASYPDENHNYEFYIDWVRVYQKEGMKNTDGIVGLTDVAADASLEVQAIPQGLSLSSDVPVWVTVCDLQGRQLYHRELMGTTQVHLSTGVYLVNGKKVLVR